MSNQTTFLSIFFTRAILGLYKKGRPTFRFKTKRMDHTISIQTYAPFYPMKEINPSKMEVAPQGCLHVISQKTNNQINLVRIDIMG